MLAVELGVFADGVAPLISVDTGGADISHVQRVRRLALVQCSGQSCDALGKDIVEGVALSGRGN